MKPPAAHVLVVGVAPEDVSVPTVVAEPPAGKGAQIKFKAPTYKEDAVTWYPVAADPAAHVLVVPPPLLFRISKVDAVFAKAYVDEYDVQMTENVLSQPAAELE